MIHSKKEAANNPDSSFTSGEGDDSKCQDEHNEPSITEMVHQFRTQTFYSSSHEEETNQLGIQSRTDVNLVIKDVPDIIYTEEAEADP